LFIGDFSSVHTHMTNEDSRQFGQIYNLLLSSSSLRPLQKFRIKCSVRHSKFIRMIM